MAETLEEWLRKLEAHNLLQRISHPVSIHEVADIIARNYMKATLIEKIDGYDISLAANIKRLCYTPPLTHRFMDGCIQFLSRA